MYHLRSPGDTGPMARVPFWIQFNNRVEPRGTRRRRGMFLPTGVSCRGSTNFHGSDLDLEGWGRDEREAVERGRQQLKQDHPELFQLEATLLRIMPEGSDEPPRPPVDQRDASEDQEFMSITETHVD